MHQFQPQTFGLEDSPSFVLPLPNPEATLAFGAAVATLLRDGGFVGLVGELGAGKTTFVQGLVRSIDGNARASSPTYTLLNEYHLEVPVWHFDLYRLDSADDLETIAYWDYAEDPDAIVVVEWIDRVPAAWHGSGSIIELRHVDGAREAAIWVTGEVDRWGAAVDKQA